jgi:hypothetical protein
MENNGDFANFGPLPRFSPFYHYLLMFVAMSVNFSVVTGQNNRSRNYCILLRVLKYN